MAIFILKAERFELNETHNLAAFLPSDLFIVEMGAGKKVALSLRVWRSQVDFYTPNISQALIALDNHFRSPAVY